VTIVNGVLSRDHVHMMVSIRRHRSVSDVVRHVKGRSSHKVPRELSALQKRYWGHHFWTRSYFCTTGGNAADDIVLQYTEQHAENPTGVNRWWFSLKTHARREVCGFRLNKGREPCRD
jgi:putative transposase